MTGQLPHEHGIHTYRADFSALDTADTFLNDLPGHRLMCVSASVWATNTFGSLTCSTSLQMSHLDAVSRREQI